MEKVILSVKAIGIEEMEKKTQKIQSLINEAKQLIAELDKSEIELVIEHQ